MVVSPGAVGSHTGMDGIYLGLNATGYRVGLSIGKLLQGDVIHQGLLPVAAWHGTATWRRVKLAVQGTLAQASLDGEVLFHALAVPPPREHRTALVAGLRVPLGTGGLTLTLTLTLTLIGVVGYAAFGTLGYHAAEFDQIHVESR